MDSQKEDLPEEVTEGRDDPVLVAINQRNSEFWDLNRMRMARGLSSPAVCNITKARYERYLEVTPKEAQQRLPVTFESMLIDVMDGRRPDWQKWNLIKTFKLFEAVGLSLNIDPHQVMRSSEGTKHGHAAYGEGDEFDTRMFVIRRHFVEKPGGTTEAPLAIDHELIDLDLFLDFAIGANWDVPDELSSLKNTLDNHSTSTGTDAEAPAEKPLQARERNTLLLIIAALAKGADIDISKPSKAGQSIQALAAGIGVKIDDGTISEKLKAAVKAVESRN